MPIRMVDDPNDQFDNSGQDNGSGGRRPGSGGGSSMIQFIPMLIGLIIKKPILLVLVLIVGGWYYFSGGCNTQTDTSSLALGGILNPKEFDKAQIYEATDLSKNPIPEAVSLLKFAPSPGNQGQQGSCVAWSSAYAARTILESVSTGQDANQIVFSPSFLYNQIGIEGCQGSLITKAMENMTRVGSVPYNNFPYDENDCSRQPSGQLKQAASQFRMLGYTRLTDGDKINSLDLHAIKEHLSKNVPVVIGMMVGGSFMQEMMGQDIWHPTEDDYNQIGFGGHAMCVIGYDDRKEGGAFQIQNSWGNDWGRNGVVWVRYSDFKHFAREAYGLNNMPKTGAAAANEQNIECAIGLIDNKTKQYIPLRIKAGNTFQTTAPLIKGTQFKMEVQNSSECYVYVLGMETDGSSYVLFPYPSKEDANRSKFSPYCGITGYRLFPRGMSMMADSIGNKDYIAVITSKDSINIFQLNKTVSSNRGIGFPQAVNAALNNQIVDEISFKNNSNGSMYFKTSVSESKVVACIVEIDKK